MTLHDMKKSRELSKRFDELFPGGHSKFRTPFDVTKNKVFIDKAKGTRIWDVDGNEYVQFNDAFGPGILGHANPEWAAALSDVLANSAAIVGSNCLFGEDDIIAAESIIRDVPCADCVKMQVTGSEAVQMAIRMARAYTGRDIVVRFSDHYHGWFDNVFGGLLADDPDLPPYQKEGDNYNDDHWTCGRFPGCKKETFILPWNDFEALERTFDKYHDQIAMIHFEAMVCNTLGLYPKPGFLEKIRELCDKYDIVMSIDEVITGYRLGLGGAQAYFGVTPDIATFAKAIGGGIPVSCVVGKRKYFDAFNKGLKGPGTFNGYALGMRAMATTLEILERDNGACYKNRQKIQDRITDGLLSIADKYGIPLRITEAPGVFFTIFGMGGGKKPVYTVKEAADGGWNPNMFVQFRLYMQEEGIIMLPGERWYIDMAHTQQDADWVLNAAESSMKKLSEDIVSGKFKK
jgi:glutamate-1-semialdehyde 2,1-aminomutase